MLASLSNPNLVWYLGTVNCMQCNVLSTLSAPLFLRAGGWLAAGAAKRSSYL
jgi:hypothetical protein